ncbi:MAG: hypothetical protein ACYTBS_24265 [Planctomycetota bacterium]
MGTRAGINFYYEDDETPAACVFRHWDGHPETTGVHLLEFFEAIKAQTGGDTRFDDPTMLASRYVVWLARFFAKDMADPDNGDYSYVNHADKRPLDFLSVRVMTEEAGDIQFRYRVICSRSKPEPTVMVDDVFCDQTLLLKEALEVGFVHEDD